MKTNGNNILWKYTSLGTQLLVAIGLAVFVGIKLDSWLKNKTPLLVWILPLIIIAAILYKVIKDTAPKK